MKIVIPGPVELESQVLLEMARPVMGHRTPDFEDILVKLWDDMKYVFQTGNDVALITGSGTAGMDAAISSTIKEGDEFICIGGGKFGERMGLIVSQYGGVPRDIKVEWGKAVDPVDVEKAVAESEAKAITLTHNETSTGVLHNAAEIGRIARENDMLFIMDGVTSVGGDDVQTDKWGVDICIVGSQKCLAGPPGLAFVAVSERAWDVIEDNPTRNFYLDLKKYRKSLKKNTTPFTPSVTLIYGMAKALEAIRKEGLEARIKRHRSLARAMREAAVAMGVELFAEEGAYSNTVTAMKIPEGLTDDDVRGRMKREHGILMAGGQEHVKGKIFRIGHMGNFTQGDLMSTISALEMVLLEGGLDFGPGSGLAAAQKVFSS